MEQLIGYWRILARRWWLILALTVLAAGSAYAFSSLQERVYRSSARLYVMPARPDHGTTYYSQSVVRQYGQLLTTDYFLGKVREGLGPSASLEELRGRVTASGNVEHLAIYLTVDDPDPQRAREVARRLTQEFVRDQHERMQQAPPDYRVDVRSYDDATPAVLFRPQTGANTLAAGLLGFLVGIVAAFASDLLDRTALRPEAVARRVAPPALANPSAPAQDA
ncbi:MAG: hypothetical protein HYY02_02920 [Chloroflexi bacterium]|nr:hypothetical protein [Chloroflexota bacterium]